MQMAEITPAHAAAVLREGRVFCDHFEITAPYTDTEEFAAQLRARNPRTKGPQEGLLRYQLESDVTQWHPHDVNMIYGTATALEMMLPETPLQGKAAAALALGGARNANFDRLDKAATAVAAGQLATERLVMLTTTRPLRQGEADAAGIPGARTEADLGQYAIERVSVKYSSLADRLALIEVPDPTADTVASLQYAFNALELPTDSEVYAVTHQICRSGQACDLGRAALGYGLRTAMGGCPSSLAVIVNRTPATYMSEVLATLDKAARYAQAA